MPLVTNFVVCKCSSCLSTPLGYRVISKRGLKHHQTFYPNTSTLSVPIPKSDHLGRQLALSMIEEELKSYQISWDDLSKMGFKRRQTCSTQSTSIKEFLDPEDNVNDQLFEFDRWRDSVSSQLQQISTGDSALTSRCDSLIKQITCLYSTIFSYISSNLEKPDTNLSTSQISPTTACRLIEREISMAASGFKFTSPLMFLCKCHDSVLHTRLCGIFPGYAYLGLDPNHTHSLSTIRQLRWIDRTIASLATQPVSSLFDPLRIEELILGLKEHQSNINAYIEAERLKQANPTIGVQTIMTYTYNPILVYSPQLVKVAMMILALKYIYYLPRRTVSDVLSYIRLNGSPYGLASLQTEQMPRDLRTYEKIVKIEIQEEQRVFCPQCLSSYPIPDIPHEELLCTSISSPASSQCRGKLYEMRNNKPTPLLLFRYRKLDNWIQEMLSRPDFIGKANAAWRSVTGLPPKVVQDFWQASIIRDMKGPDNLTPVSSIPENETRLLLSLAVDWFNPYHNKIGGRLASTGVMFMTCLNLPLMERFKEENVYFVGLMPGEKQQSNLDGVLKPLVDDLSRYWTKGVLHVGIPGLDSPRLIRCAVVQLICDLPAARKVAGFPNHSATHHCSICYSTRSNIMDTSLAHEEAFRRDLASHMAHATNYKSILDKNGRRAAESLMKANPKAARWSELNRLTYWDPIRHTVLDSMHLILLGLCKFHWRKFWGGSFLSRKSTGDKNQSKYTINDEGEGDSTEEEVEDLEDLGITDTKAHSHRDEMTLDAEKMNKARFIWVTRQSSSFIQLNVAQILCLLKENGAEMPRLSFKKAILIDLLITCREAYKHLPRQVRKVNGKYIIKQDPPSGGEIPGHEVTVSRSEELLGGLVPVPIPQIPRPENKQRSFITNEELNQIQSDLKSIIVPSWVEKPRAKFGDKSNGKVKAAEWGTLFTIYIPLTMLRLWGIEMTRALTTDYILHLKALLTLTIIVNITTSVSSSSAIIQLYDTSVHLYLRLISVLNRDRSLVVNHHLALHVSEFMKLHGPSRTHWAFPFERLIGKLQKIPHNSHIDDITGSLFKAFSSGIALDSLLKQGVQCAALPRWRQPKTPKSINQYRFHLDDKLKATLKGTYGLSSSWARSLESVVVDHVTYRGSEEGISIGDANIGYKDVGSTGFYRIGTIRRILSFTQPDTRDPNWIILLVAQYTEAPKPFRGHIWSNVITHDALGTCVVGTAVEPDLRVVTLDRLIGHVAVSKVSKNGAEGFLTMQLTKNFEIRRHIRLNNVCI